MVLILRDAWRQRKRDINNYYLGKASRNFVQPFGTFEFNWHVIWWLKCENFICCFRVTVDRDLAHSVSRNFSTDTNLRNVRLVAFIWVDLTNQKPRSRKWKFHSACYWCGKEVVDSTRAALWGIIDVFLFWMMTKANVIMKNVSFQEQHLWTCSNTSFTCDHIIQAKEAVEPLAVHSLSKEVIHEYKGDHSTKEKLTEIMNAFQYPQLIQLSPTLFSVYGPPTSSNPIGFVHVTIGNGKVECSSSDCKGYGSVMRQQKNTKICIHCHILLCFYSLATLIPTPSCSSSMLAPGSDTVAESPSPEVVKTSSQLECNDMESETLTSRQSTIELNMLNTLPYQIPRNIFDRIALNDSRSIDSENGKEGWPVTYCPECDCCRLCGSQLSIPRPHPGQKTGAVSYLLTNGVPFLPVTVFVKLCLKTQCKAMHQVFLFDIGEYIIYYINFMYQFYFVSNYIYVNRIRSQRFLFVWLNSYFPFFKVCSTSAISSLCHWTFYWSSESPLKEEFPSQLLLRASLQFFYWRQSRYLYQLCFSIELNLHYCKFLESFRLEGDYKFDHERSGSGIIMYLYLSWWRL